MKVAVLAGGLGTRLAEETSVRPKPMVTVGGRPLLWHIMKHFAAHEFHEFFIALGYKGDDIKRYFVDYPSLRGSLRVDIGQGTVESLDSSEDSWSVNLIETGHSTSTGGRVKRLEPYFSGDRFMVTYGDGVSNVDLRALLAFHEAAGRVATVTAVRPPARFGGLVFEGPLVREFTEKPQVGEGWINGGFFVFEPKIFDYLKGDETSLEYDVLPRLCADGQLAAYRHRDFWQCVDTLRDRHLLEHYWQKGEAPWKSW